MRAVSGCAWDRALQSTPYPELEPAAFRGAPYIVNDETTTSVRTAISVPPQHYL